MRACPGIAPSRNSSLTSGKAFVAMDRLLEECRSGPLPWSRPEIAQVVVEALGYGQDTLRYYTLHAFVVMPYHVHLLLTPHVAVPKLLRTLKAFTARRANRILGSTGKPFWRRRATITLFVTARNGSVSVPTLSRTRCERDWPLPQTSIAGRAPGRKKPAGRPAAALEGRPTRGFQEQLSTYLLDTTLV